MLDLSVRRVPELKTHTLLRIGGAAALATEADSDLPTWVGKSLQRAPWVVVRRAQMRDGLIPVGVRGESRQERFASWICANAVLEYVTPQALAARRPWATTLEPSRCAVVPALATLDRADRIMSEHGLQGLWGPGGSVGFELASGVPAATASSDLDLVIYAGRLEPGGPLGQSSMDIARSLVAALATLPVRVDVLLELPDGALALAEYIRPPGGSVMLRTTEGPRLIPHVRAARG
jgi:phosphoribosyl-dephospho-CoA transferase